MKLIPDQKKRHTILLVDDDPTNLTILRHTLAQHYRLLYARDGQTALELAAHRQPCLVLLDVMMKGLSGHEVCIQLKANPLTRDIPVIFITALNDAENEHRGLELGAVDYIAKPFSPAIVRARVRTHLSLVRAEEVLETRHHIIQSLGVAAEYRDNETGLHTLRIGHYSRCLARAIDLDEELAEELFHAAPMHDVGKIGIPDAILLKPGPLDPAERALMEQHTLIGARIIGEHHSSLLRMAARIALHHHERWDGHGYPHGLAGEDIPLEARIVGLVDVFDALTSVRPYKPAWSLARTMDYIEAQRGHHFDPRLVDALVGCLSEILAIRSRWPDRNPRHDSPAAAEPSIRQAPALSVPAPEQSPHRTDSSH